MVDVTLLWGFASVVILLGQCVIVWKAFQIFKAVVASEEQVESRAVKRVEELLAEHRPQPPFDVEGLLGKMQDTYLGHLEEVRSKQHEQYEALLQKRDELYQEQLAGKEEQIKWLTEDARRIRRSCPPQLLAAMSADRDLWAADGKPILESGRGRDYHLFWIAHDLLWAMTIDPVDGIQRALEHVERAGLKQRKIAGTATVEQLLQRQLEAARAIENGDTKARRELNDVLADIKLKLAGQLSG